MQPIWIDSIDGICLQGVIHRCPSPTSVATIIQAHGITVDMNEGGMYVRLAERLAASGFNVVRFSFRGHGWSSGTQRGVTVAGEMLDLQAALEFTAKEFAGPVAIVASSFGAVSTCLSLPFIKDSLTGLVFWNPVLDLKRTFISPELPWAKQSFTDAAVKDLYKRGFLLLDSTFEVGRVLYEEMKNLDPRKYFIEHPIPSMIVHGDKDTYVSYDIARDAADAHNNCSFHTIEGADHGFDGDANEARAIELTATWLQSLSWGQ